MRNTRRITSAVDRNLEFDLQALSARLRADRGFAVELYCALCNADWRHVDGVEWHGSWRYAAGLVATLRGCGEEYLDFYCSGGKTRSEGTISERVAEAMSKLGWTGTGYGSEHLLGIDLNSGRTQVMVDGEWVDLEESGILAANRYADTDGSEIQLGEIQTSKPERLDSDD